MIQRSRVSTSDFILPLLARTANASATNNTCPGNPKEVLPGLVSGDNNPARVALDGEVAGGWSDSGASSSNGLLASTGSPPCGKKQGPSLSH